MKVRVSSYQSIRSAEIEAVGFTAITGHSNIGKSALLRATAAALFGQEGDHFVRKGEAACAVTVEHDGHTIEWQKVRKKKPGLENCVILDGEKFTRLGKGHGDLIGPLGYCTIKAGGEQIRPQYAEQFNDIFLLTATPNTAAEIFKMLGRVDTVTRAQESAKHDLRKTVSTLGVRETDSAEAWESLCVLGWVTAFEEWYRQLREKVEERQAQAGVAANLWSAIDYHAMQGEPRDLPAEPALPDPSPTARLLGQVEEIQAVAPRELPAAPGLVDETLEIVVADEMLKQIEEIQAVAPLGELPAVPGLGVLKDAIGFALLTLEEIAQYEAGDDEGQHLASERGQAERDVLSAEMRKSALEEELGACPICQREFGEAV